jgi:4-coumarate--CoA ligase
MSLARSFLSFTDKQQQGWGMTEATCSILGWDPRLTYNPNSVGELNANCHAKIMGDDGKEVAPGERGEIWVQAPKLVHPHPFSCII